MALARALALMPRLLLLDEPFASLDANMRATVRADVEQILRQNGTTAILVTHDQDEALSIADLVAVLRGGTIAQVAAPQDLYSHPRDPDLARFVGEANLVVGVATDDVVVTALGPVAMESPATLGSGGRLTVLVRPEQIEVHPGSRGPGGTRTGDQHRLLRSRRRRPRVPRRGAGGDPGGGPCAGWAPAPTRLSGHADRPRRGRSMARPPDR